MQPLRYGNRGTERRHKSPRSQYYGWVVRKWECSWEIFLSGPPGAYSIHCLTARAGVTLWVGSDPAGDKPCTFGFMNAKVSPTIC